MSLILFFYNLIIVIFLTLFQLIMVDQIIIGSCVVTKQLRKLVEMVSVSNSLYY